MAIRAVVFDIGGVLEITPDLGVTPMWETRLGLPAGELNERMHDAWAGGSIGTITEYAVHAVHFQHNAQVIEDIERLLASS